jgi:hypothetical protein
MILLHILQIFALITACIVPTTALPSLSSIFESLQYYTQSLSYGNATTQTLSNPFPYDFPEQNAANTTELFPMPLCHGVKIEEASIDELQGHLERGELTSEQLVLCYLQRIWQTNEYINSVLEVNPDFLTIAAQLDEERRSGRVRGRLHGIPFMVCTSPFWGLLFLLWEKFTILWECYFVELHSSYWVISIAKLSPSDSAGF